MVHGVAEDDLHWVLEHLAGAEQSWREATLCVAFQCGVEKTNLTTIVDPRSAPAICETSRDLLAFSATGGKATLKHGTKNSQWAARCTEGASHSCASSPMLLSHSVICSHETS